MFDEIDCISLIDHRIEKPENMVDIFHMEPVGGFV